MHDGAPSRRLVVTADDLGLRASWDEAIARASGEGVVTSVAIVTTGPRFEQAAAALRRDGTDHGVHLDLLDGAPLSRSADIASVVDRRGRFHALPALLLRFASGRVRAREVEREWTAQIERALSAGLHPTHINGHYHLHLLPGLFAVAVGLAARFGIAWIRVPAEPPWLGALSAAQRTLASRRAVAPLESRGPRPTPHAWRRALRRSRGDVAEIFCHPGQSTRETELLSSPDLRRAIDGRFRRTSFRDIHGAS